MPLPPLPMYYRLRPTPVLEGLYDVKPPDVGVRWLSGLLVSAPLPTPLTVELDDSFGTRMADLFDNNILVMSDRLVSALRRAGVTNLQTFPVVLEDARRRIQHGGYQAVQVLGRVRAADPDQSVAYDPDKAGRTIVDFEKLVISEEAAHGLLMFRLLEDASALIVHHRVKQELDRESWEFVSVHPTDEEPEPLDLDDYAGTAGGASEDGEDGEDGEDDDDGEPSPEDDETP